MSSHAALCSEYDRCVESSEHTESSMLESIRSERAQLVESFTQQRQAFEKAFAAQERAIEESSKRQDSLLAKAHQSRLVGKSTIEEIRKEFQEIRAAAADRERLLHAQAIAANRKLNKNSTTIHRSPSASSRFSDGSTTGESRNPHSSRNHRTRLERTINQVSSSQSSSDDGHLVRLLDKRAAAQAQQSGDIRDQRLFPNPASSDSSTQHEPYYVSPQRNLTPQRQQLPYSAHQNKGGDYSLDQYSHDTSESTSTCSSYDMRSSRRAMEPPPSNHHHHHHESRHHPWDRHSYCDESSME